jgi:hypothetical protein
MAGRKSRRTKVLGIAVPKSFKPENLVRELKPEKLMRELKPEKLMRELKPEKLMRELKPEKLISGRIDHEDLLRRIGDAAEVIEKRSDEVRLVSSQAKRISRKLA